MECECKYPRVGTLMHQRIRSICHWGQRAERDIWMRVSQRIDIRGQGEPEYSDVHLVLCSDVAKEYSRDSSSHPW